MERFYKSNNNDVLSFTPMLVLGFEKDIHEYKPDDLNEILKKFYVELRKN